jgi:hypothetical protein
MVEKVNRVYRRTKVQIFTITIDSFLLSSKYSYRSGKKVLRLVFKTLGGIFKVELASSLTALSKSCSCWTTVYSVYLTSTAMLSRM